MTKVKHLMDETLDFFWPEKIICALCEEELGQNSTYFCKKCEPKKLPMDLKRCRRCSAPIAQAYVSYENYQYLCKSCQEQSHAYDYHLSLSLYEDSIKKTLYAMKYQGKTHLAKILGQELARLYEDNQNRLEDVDYIIPVPSHWTRRAVRGHHHAAIMAKSMAKKLELPYFNPLKRVKKTSALSGLRRQEREKTLKDVFRLKKRYFSQIRGKKLLIVDDIYTTGITVHYCAEILKQSGAEVVYVMTAAMGRS